MKKITFLLLGLLMMTSASTATATDEYKPLVKEGRKWVYLWYEQIGSGTNIKPLFLYSLDIRQYGEVYCTLLDKDMNPISESSIVALLRENHSSSHKVERFPLPDDWPTQPQEDFIWHDYMCFVPFWYSAENEIYEIYDFSINGFLPNPPLYISPSQAEQFRNIGGEISVEVEGVPCKGYILNEGDFFFEAKVIEGIGIDSRSGDLLTPQRDVYPLSWAEWPGLVAVYQGDELIYEGCLYHEAMQFAGINTVDSDKQVRSVRYYNLAGVESAEPQQGVSIKVTTYSDGSRTSEKVLLK